MLQQEPNLWLQRRLLAIATAALLAAAVPAESDGQDFSLAMSPSEPLLVAPNDPIVQKVEMWDSPLLRVIERSRPFVEIRNTSAQGSGEQLTAFTMTIGDTDYNFSNEVLGDFIMLGTSTPGVAIESVSVNPSDAISSVPGGVGDVLTVRFGDGGLDPGEVVRFQIDLDGDPGLDKYIHPDYRTVLFDIFGNDNSDNSNLTFLFEPSDSTLGAVLPDLDQPPGSAFVNGDLRPYSEMDPVEIVEPEGMPVIPEPGSAVLALMAAAGAAAARMRRRLG